MIPSVTFGASDMPLKLDQLDKDGLIQFPTVIGGALAMNVRCTPKPIVSRGSWLVSSERP